MNDLRGWASEWVQELIADGGAHGPGSRRTISLNGDDWLYLTDDDVIERSIEDLRQTTLSRPPGRYAVTFERSMSGTSRLHIYAVECRADAPPQRLHLAQPFTSLMTGGCKATGDISEFADEAARHQPRKPTRTDSHDGANGTQYAARTAAAPRPAPARPRTPSTPLWQAVVAGAIFFIALIVHSSYSGQSSDCTVSESGNSVTIYDTPACDQAFHATDISKWVMIAAGGATVGLAVRRYRGQ